MDIVNYEWLSGSNMFMKQGTPTHNKTTLKKYPGELGEGLGQKLHLSFRKVQYLNLEIDGTHFRESYKRCGDVKLHSFLA